MGCANSTSNSPSKLSPEEIEWNRRIEEDLIASAQQELPVIKLLLLGTGASGKSTIFKQITRLYGEGFNSNQLNTYKSLVRKNAINAIKTLLEHIPKYSTEIKDNSVISAIVKELNGERIQSLFGVDLKAFIRGFENKGYSKTASTIESSEINLEEKLEDNDDEDILNFGLVKKSGESSINNAKLTPEMALYIQELWTNPIIQLVYSHSDEFQLVESASFFLNRIKAVGHSDYIPSDEDLLRVRAPTTGVVEQKFQIDQREFCLFDVGGQRNERRKWIHCFENVTAVLFICGISEYNQSLYEDSTTNRLEESFSLFGEIAGNKFLSKTSLILFLNKKDLFQQKLPLHPLTKSFPAYEGPNEYESCIEWIKNQFQKKIKSSVNRKLYVHETCATDSNNIKLVFDSVKDIVVRQHTGSLVS